MFTLMLIRFFNIKRGRDKIMDINQINVINTEIRNFLVLAWMGKTTDMKRLQDIADSVRTLHMRQVTKNKDRDILNYIY